MYKFLRKLKKNSVVVTDMPNACIKACAVFLFLSFFSFPPIRNSRSIVINK